MKKEAGIFQKIGDTLWLHLEGRTYTVSEKADSLNEHGKNRTLSALASGLMKSPMPGKILKIPIKTGDVVKSGQTVCMIEAMKMEYALKAPFEGRIKVVHKKIGDLVQLDEPVIEIEKGSL